MGALDPRARPLQIFTGKGGVGKTTLVLATALAWAERGRRPIVVELGHRASIAALLDRRDPIDWAPVEVGSGVHATNVNADRAVLEMLASLAPAGKWVARTLRGRSMRALLGAAPGVIEVATLARLLVLREEGWNPILLDADSSGHARMFVEVPRLLSNLGARGAIGSMLKRAASILSAPEQSALHLITLPGALPVQEMRELDRGLRGHSDVDLGVVFVNRIPRALEISEASVRALAGQAKDGGAADLAIELEALLEELELGREIGARVEALVGEMGRSVVKVPELERPSVSIDDLFALGRIALEGAP